MEGLRAEATVGNKKQAILPQETQGSIEICPDNILQLIAQKIPDTDLVAVSFSTTSLRKVAKEEMSRRVQEVLSHKSSEKIVNNIQDWVNPYKLVEDKWDMDTVKKCLSGTLTAKIDMRDLESVSTCLPSTILGRYLMMGNVILCGQKQRGEKIGKNEDERLKLHIMKGSSIEYMTNQFSEIVSGNPQDWFRYAARNGHVEMVKYLVARFELTVADARAEDNDPLRCAAGNGHMEMVKYLVDRFELTVADARADNNYALRWAAHNGHIEMVKYLVGEFELKVDDARANDNFALRYAAWNRQIEMVQYLVERFELTAEDVAARDHGILRLAIHNQNQPLLHFLRTRFNYTKADL